MPQSKPSLLLLVLLLLRDPISSSPSTLRQGAHPGGPRNLTLHLRHHIFEEVFAYTTTRHCAAIVGYYRAHFPAAGDGRLGIWFIGVGGWGAGDADAHDGGFCRGVGFEMGRDKHVEVVFCFVVLEIWRNEDSPDYRAYICVEGRNDVDKHK